ncbi:hypothetical protein AUK11_00090 [bacterium CG2_30_37_16]|nr:MAG: hypothetical protein AUK11_00090 [bacterium CG2_30_37_16]PIP30581.1 MAG: hypothetical protein COX25_04015 [bacterium (Candidatus Howlettbacteria) CG23_combo_of_CG06-09_8_20_14_all_37_9]PIX99668.1 MAG: hypothetical protein COZ22_02040 [bacterium (Candidatus Howlettbacteria) CG_4_10_14_3_um_filter_37_10]PJB06490.1 MAG: hypothetical protein CO123_02095 [bacterium (Candidatus Howlettbacteria) CG_4_9_14_3_um_filter_37_10]
MKKFRLTSVLSILMTFFFVMPAGAVNEKTSHSDQALQKITFIHYKKGYLRGEAKKPRSGASACYAFLGKGVVWKTLPLNYVIDPDNPNNLSESFVANAIYQASQEWNKYADRQIFNTYSVDYNSSWDDVKPDGRNEFVFGNYPKGGVIAITNIWGYFGGPINSRQIIEYDVMFDTDFNWGDGSANPALMDLQNIATHEIGHGIGLSDLYETGCSTETMFGYSYEGDLAKSTLNTGDILGIKQLY